MLSADLPGPCSLKGALRTAAHRGAALDRITSDAIYYHTDFYLLSHSLFSAFLHHSGPTQLCQGAVQYPDDFAHHKKN